jgi:ankyrin repeat protein
MDSKADVNAKAHMYSEAISVSNIEPNFRCCRGSALHFAAFHGHVDFVRLIIDAKTDVNAIDKYSQPPFTSTLMRILVSVVPPAG